MQLFILIQNTFIFFSMDYLPTMSPANLWIPISPAIPENPSILIIKIPNDPKTPWSQKICGISISKFKADIVENNMKRHPKFLGMFLQFLEIRAKNPKLCLSYQYLKNPGNNEYPGILKNPRSQKMFRTSILKIKAWAYSKLISICILSF